MSAAALSQNKIISNYYYLLFYKKFQKIQKKNFKKIQKPKAGINSTLSYTCHLTHFTSQ